jgi:GWxTD domain-containing protein
MNVCRPWLLLVSAVIPLLGFRQGESLTDRLARATESQLDSLYGPLVYIMRPEERGVYPGLTASGKRQFLEHFWAQRDPTPGTPRNEAAEAFNARIAVVNKKFRVGGANEIPGWRTDRGRIFLALGQPDIMLIRRGPGVRFPFEMWKYTAHGAQRKYCFVDLARFGNYVLVFSTDPHEPSRPQWRQLLGDDEYEDALNF